MDKQYRDRMARDVNKRTRRTSDFPCQDFKTVTCPNCGSGQIRTVQTRRETESAVTRRHRCKLCDSRFPTIGTIPPVDRDPKVLQRSQQDVAKDKD